MDITQYFAKDLYAGKTVFVTGGGSGINLGIAKNFAALGANIAICGRTRERLDVAAQGDRRHRQRQDVRPSRRRTQTRRCRPPSTRRGRRWVRSTCSCAAPPATSCAAPRT